MNNILILINIGALSVGILMFIFWLIHLRLKNAGVIDIGWALCLFGLALIYAIGAPGFIPRKFAILCLVSIWAARLCWLLANRVLKDKREDNRYQKLLRPVIQ